MKRILVALFVASGALAQQLPIGGPAPAMHVLTLNVHLVTGLTVMSGYNLDGGTRPPAVGYQVGATVLHLNINAKDYDLSGEALGFLSLGGALSAGAAGCVGPHDGGWVGGVICLGAAADVRDPQGHGVFSDWVWRRNLTLLASAGLHF